MKQKNTFITLLVIFALICVYNIQYSVRRISLDYELNDMTTEQRSRWLENADNADSYKTLTRNSLSLGLDLQGGMFVTLEIGVDDVLKSLAGSAADAAFLNALDSARVRRESSQEDFVALFFRTFKELNPNKNINAYFSPEVTGLEYTASEPELMAKLQAMAQEAVDNSLTVLRARIDQFGVASPNIQPQENGRIIVELPGVKDNVRVQNLLRKTASLEFWPVYTLAEAIPTLQAINTAVQRIQGVQLSDSAGTDSSATTNADSSQVAATTPATPDTAAQTATTDSPATGNLLAEDTAGATAAPAEGDTAAAAKFARENPYFAVCTPPQVQTQEDANSTCEVGFALARDTSKINAWLASEEVRTIMPNDMRLLWTAKNVGDNTQQYALISVRVNVEGVPPLTGANVSSTNVDRNDRGQVAISMNMDSDGRRAWGRLTTENVGRPVAVVLDNLVYTYPRVNEAILSGSTEITGSFTIEEANDVANILKAGKMPAPARIEGIEIVGPTLGAATVSQGFIAFLCSFIAVLIVTFAYYRRLGAIADIALLVNLFFVIGVMSALQVVLTLPGIAGLVLSMGMAVDANVLIYEKMREELAAGRGIRGAITNGFNSALSAIIDGNLTTFLTGLILLIFGTGPIAGFAVTLMIGIVTTLISALLVTRLLMDRVASRPDAGEKLAASLTGVTGFFLNAKYKFIAGRKKWYAITGVLVVLSIASMAGLGFRTGIDFQGGRQYTVEFPGTLPTSEQVSGQLSASLGGTSPLVRTIGTGNQMLITTSYQISDASADATVKAAMLSGLSSFGVTEANLVRETKVGPTVARDIQEGAIKAILFALLVMFAYIFIRFGRWQFGVSAIASLAFNVVVTLGIFSALGAINGLPFSVEIDQNILAALLTIVGYTINDTVVVFDYIRDALKNDKTGEDPDTIFNRALNDTLSRTIITSVTTLLSVIILFFFAGDSLQGFMFALFIGIIVGTFSSLLVASPLALDLAKKKLLADAKAKHEARRAAVGTSRKKLAEDVA